MAESWSFQGRVEHSGDNGNDFERFVLECFRVAKGEAALFKCLRRGRDGAIDLIDQHSEPGATTVAECKYIGVGGLKEAKARWKEVYDRLADYLPRLSANPGKNPASPYRTWLDPARPVRRYRFCITISLTFAEIIRLEKLITQDFAKLADAGAEAVRHLAETEGAVRVFSWDWFHAELTACPSLAFRWFRGLPIGVSVFDQAGRTGQSFRDFLSGAQLTYFSRDSFVAQGGGLVARREAGLIADLISGEAGALVLAGPGGVGKTRLAHELAINLTDERVGFDAYWLDRSASAASIQMLMTKYIENAAILLLVDYAESAQMLGEVADLVAYLIEQGSHKIRIIATCRASAMNKIRGELENLNPKVKNLASRLEGEDAYLDWVTRSILSLEPFREPDRLVKVCHGIPALAAFAVYLFRNDRPQFDTQFGALLADNDFQSWSSRRIAGLIRNTLYGERSLAEIALALPVPPDSQELFQEAYGDLVDRLLADRWIEYVDGHLAAAHDILADALLARWLFEAETATTVRAISLLSSAAAAQALPNALTVFARLATHPGFTAIDGRQVLQALLATHHEQVATSAGEFFRSAFLKAQDKLDLIANIPDVAETIKTNSRLRVGLVKLAEQVVNIRNDGEELRVPAVFGDLLEEACSKSERPDLFLRNAFLFDPARFRERAFASIAVHPYSETTCYMIALMLRSGEAPETMREPLCNWLNRNLWYPRARGLYQAWFAAGGDKDVVCKLLSAWASVHGRGREAQFAYKAWLDAGGDLESIEQHVFDWALTWWYTEDFVYLSKAISTLPTVPEPVALAVVRWVVSFPAHEDSLTRLRRLIGHLSHADMSIPGFMAVTNCLSYLANALEPRSALERSQIWSICASLSDPRLFNLDPYGVLRFLARIIGSGRVFDRHLTFGPFHYLSDSYASICHMSILAIREGMLEPVTDREALTQFVEWIKCATASSGDAPRLIAKLRSQIP